MDVAARAADDEAADDVPPSERPTTAMVDDLADAFDAKGGEDGRPWLGQMPRVAGYVGPRLGELTSLRPVDVDEERQGVMVATAWTFSVADGAEQKTPKNGRRRFVLLPMSLFLEVLARAKQVEAEHGPYALLYPGPKGPLEPFTEGELRRVFEPAARAAGWECHPDTVSPKGKRQKGRPVIPWRNLRHHAATWLHEVAGFEWVDVSARSATPPSPSPRPATSVPRRMLRPGTGRRSPASDAGPVTGPTVAGRCGGWLTAPTRCTSGRPRCTPAPVRSVDARCALGPVAGCSRNARAARRSTPVMPGRSSPRELTDGGAFTWLTLTAPGAHVFGAVHSGPTKRGKRRCACGRYHRPDDARLGTPVDPVTYDYGAAARFNATLSRRFTVLMQKLRRLTGERLDFVRVVEFQRRGLTHVHALVRGVVSSEMLGVAVRGGVNPRTGRRIRPVTSGGSAVGPSVTPSR